MAGVGDRDRTALGELFAAFARDVGKADGDVAVERERAHDGPVPVAWVVRVDDSIVEVPAHEPWMCAGGALMSLRWEPRMLEAGRTAGSSPQVSAFP